MGRQDAGTAEPAAGVNGADEGGQKARADVKPGAAQPAAVTVEEKDSNVSSFHHLIISSCQKLL
jgi:hypothetical protein